MIKKIWVVLLSFLVACTLAYMLHQKGIELGIESYKQELLSYRPVVDGVTYDFSSVVSTNFLDHRNMGGYSGLDAFDYKVRHKMFYVSYLIYTQHFSELYGYPEDYVSEDLPEHVQAMELCLIGQSLYVNMLVDQRIGIEFPKKLNDEKTYGGMYWPLKVQGYTPTDKQKNFANNIRLGKSFYYFRNVYLATMNYKQNVESKKNSSGTRRIRSWAGGITFISSVNYQKQILPNLDYISVRLGSGRLVQSFLGHPLISIWIKKEGARDYRNYKGYAAKDFIRFLIPHQIKMKMLKVLRQTVYFSRSELERFHAKRREYV